MRTFKTGLDYFSFDVDFFEDEKIEFVSAKFGELGELILIKLLCRIYRNGYFIEFGEDEQLLFAKRSGENITIELVSQVVDEALKRNFFSKEHFEKYQILTSNGIQKRYFEATQRRKEIPIFSEYLINVNINPENVNIIGLNDGKSTQRKGKERKGKEITVKYTLSDSKKPNPNASASNGVYSENFEKFWKDLPSQMKVGKKEAFEIYKSTVHSNIDFENLLTAIEKYKNSDRFQRGIIQNGSNWLKNWTDWIDYDEPKKETKDERRKREMDEAFNRVFKDEETAKENKNEFF